VPNWLEAVPDPNVSAGKVCAPIKIEMVIRGYLAGHAWRLYRDGQRVICGETMPDGMRESDRFPNPIITPATKADSGHDEDISKNEIKSQGIVTAEVYEKLEGYTHGLYERGHEMALERGLILVDTKYEFGFNGAEICLIDEVHTPDSSRYYYADGYNTRQAEGIRQEQLSKEFVREWLMTAGFQGLDGQVMPIMPDNIVKAVSDRYVELYERMTGRKFEPSNVEDIHGRIKSNIDLYLAEL
jgi:phosphoribosylaminoimidazole-succinocarboxamide synthase